MGVSRSGYHNYFTEESAQKRAVQEKEDETVKDIILKAYRFRGRKKGRAKINIALRIT